jgi:1-acyl-sn-glycerol-3-phosphate acyltransferase
MSSHLINWYALTRGVFHAGFRAFNNIDVHGREFVPASGPFIMASSHASFADPPICAAACSHRNDVHYMARKTLFQGRFGSFISAIQAFPVDRDGVSDMKAFRTVFQLLQQGRGLVLFPEGTRSPDGSLQPIQAGIGLIACRAQVPVIPARIFGNFELFGRHSKWPDPFQPIAISLGQPLLPADYDPGKGTKERFDKAAAVIAQGIAAIDPPHYERF